MPKLQLKTPDSTNSTSRIPQQQERDGKIQRQIDGISKMQHQMTTKSIIQKGINYEKQQERKKQAEQKMLHVNTRIKDDFKDLEKFINTVERYRKR